MVEEIERKFLVFDLPDLENVDSRDFVQGYFFDSHHDQVRLRKRTNSEDLTNFTIKRDEGETRDEFEIPLTENQFKELWSATEGRRVWKTRYFIPLNSYTAELDIYKKRLEPLKTVEVEFGTKQESQDFSPPEWFGPEVTEEGTFKNKQLALNGLPKAFEDYEKLYGNTLT